MAMKQLAFSSATTASSAIQDSYDAISPFWSLQVKGNGGIPTSFNVVLEGCNDGFNFTTILTATVDGTTVFQAAGVVNPVRYFRIRVTALTLGPAASITCFVSGTS